jgi:phosphohistidine phosphatase SixA
MTTEYHVSIMRHAKSDWDVGARADFERPLSPRGERDAARMAKWLLEQTFVPDLIVSSTAVRAEQTARIVAHALGGIPITWRDDLYLAQLDVLVGALADPPAGNWMLIGHNPGLEDLVEFCAAAGTLAVCETDADGGDLHGGVKHWGCAAGAGLRTDTRAPTAEATRLTQSLARARDPRIQATLCAKPH